MFKIGFKPKFLRQYKKLPPEIKIEVRERMEILKDNYKHPLLKTHKLQGKLHDFYSCWVNFSYRIVFTIHKSGTSKEIILHFVGNHKIYA